MALVSCVGCSSSNGFSSINCLKGFSATEQLSCFRLYCDWRERKWPVDTLSDVERASVPIAIGATREGAVSANIPRLGSALHISIDQILAAEICAGWRTDRLALALGALFLVALADVVPYNWVGSVRAGWRRTIRARWVPEDLIWFFNRFPTCSPRWGCSRPCPRWCSRGGWGRCTGASYSSPPLSGRQLLGIDIASP